MVAQLLRLKLRLLGNIFRRSAWQVVGIAVGLIYGLGAAFLVFAVLSGLRGFDDVELIRDGKMKALLITSPNRSALLPDVPTAREAGLPELTLEFWAGVLAPAGTPAEVVAPDWVRRIYQVELVEGGAVGARLLT